MVIGQGVGVAAALAAERDLPAQKVDYAELQGRLLAQGQELQLPIDLQK